MWNNLIPDTQGALTSLSFNAGDFQKGLTAAVNEGSGDKIKTLLVQYNQCFNPKTGKYEVLNGLDVRRKDEAGMMDGRYKDVWDNTIIRGQFVEGLINNGASAEEIGQIMKGIAKVEIREKGKDVFRNYEGGEMLVETKAAPQKADNPKPVIISAISEPKIEKKVESDSHPSKNIHPATRKLPEHVLQKAREVTKKETHKHTHHHKSSNHHLQPYLSSQDDCERPNPGNFISPNNNDTSRQI